MANKYVSIQGNNANAGTGPLHDQAWRTIDYGIDAMDDGDVLYVGPGIYRELVNPADSPASERIIRGDPQNTKGFTDSSDVLVPAGPCIVTDLLTDDVTASTSTSTITTNGKDYITLEKLWIENLSGTAIAIPSGSEHITIRDCKVFSFGNCIEIAVAANTRSYIVVDRCILQSANNNGVSCTFAKHTADYNADVLVTNCKITGSSTGSCTYLTSTASSTNFGGGLVVQNCFLFGYYGLRVSTNYSASITDKCQLKNSVTAGGNGVNQGAGAAGDVIVEDYNFLFSNTARTNVATGAHSIAYGDSATSFARSIRLDFGQSELFGFLPKSFMAPWSTSRTIGYGNDSTPTALTVDILNRPRPSGSGIAAASVLNAVGPYELHDYGVKETTVKDAGDASIKLTGPGDHDIRVPVDASATVISIKARFDSATYGGANYPQAILLDAADIGVSTETKTATIAASDAWETLTFSSFTPTLKGWVVIRLLNRGSGADDICYFDTLAVT